jgi:hypothetical protein
VGHRHARGWGAAESGGRTAGADQPLQKDEDEEQQTDHDLRPPRR